MDGGMRVSERLRNRGFTLIELLVVIAVIGILAAIFFPVFRAAREQGRLTSCASNLSQLGKAMKMYGADWDNMYPDAYEWGWYPDLVDCLGKYVSDEKDVWKCPSDSGDAPLYGSSTPYWQRYHTSYNWPGRNYKQMGWPYLAGLSQSEPVGESVYAKWVWGLPPNRRIMMFDGRPWHFCHHRDRDWTKVKGLLNVVFCDGHVSKLESTIIVQYLYSDTDPFAGK